MSAERKPYVMPRKSRFSAGYDRSNLQEMLEVLGNRNFETKQFWVTPPEKNFLKQCIREDLGIAQDMNLKVRWYDTGNAFSVARDHLGNNIIRIHLGSKDTLFEVGFDKQRFKFVGLYYQHKPVTENLLRQLL